MDYTLWSAQTSFNTRRGFIGSCTGSSWEVGLQGQFDLWFNDVVKASVALTPLSTSELHADQFPHGGQVAAVVSGFLAICYTMGDWESEGLL